MPARASTITAYTATEAARLIGVSRVTIWNDIQSGRLVAHRAGRGTIIFAGDLLDYVIQYRGGRGIPAD